MTLRGWLYSAMAGSGGTIGLAELPDSLLAAAPDAPPGPTPPPEAQLLLQYLRAAGWNVTQVAHQLGVSRMTVYRRMRRWGIGHEPAGPPQGRMPQDAARKSPGARGGEA